MRVDGPTITPEMIATVFYCTPFVGTLVMEAIILTLGLTLGLTLILSNHVVVRTTRYLLTEECELQMSSAWSLFILRRDLDADDAAEIRI